MLNQQRKNQIKHFVIEFRNLKEYTRGTAKWIESMTFHYTYGQIVSDRHIDKEKRGKQLHIEFKCLVIWDLFGRGLKRFEDIGSENNKQSALSITTTLLG